MKKHIWIAALVFAAAFTSCKKDDKENEESVTKLSTQAEDNNDTKSESDQTNTDVTDALENFSSINGRKAVTEGKKVICGCSIDSSQLENKILVLNFDGITPCGTPSRTRSGSIKVQLVEGDRWIHQGARLKITHNNFKVTRLKDSKSWTFNGDKYLTNVRGTNWLGFIAGVDSLLYRERGAGLTVALSGGGIIHYSVARTTSWKVIKSQTISDYIQFSAMGDTTISGLANTDTWGTNRFDNAFTNNYLSRLVSNTYCQVWRPVRGELVHRANGNTLTLKMGVNEQGQTDTRDCAYGWKLNWLLANGATGEKIFSY